MTNHSAALSVAKDEDNQVNWRHMKEPTKEMNYLAAVNVTTNAQHQMIKDTGGRRGCLNQCTVQKLM